LAVFQNAFDEYAHGPFRRVLAADDREAQTLFARSLFQYERVERAERRPGTSRQRAKRRAIRVVPLQVHGGHVVPGVGLSLRRRYVHHRLSVFVVLLDDGRRRPRRRDVTVVVVHGRLGHPLPRRVAAAVRRFGHVELGIPFGHQQVHGGAAVVQQTVGFDRVQSRQTTAVHVQYPIARFQIASPTITKRIYNIIYTPNLHVRTTAGGAVVRITELL